MDEKGIKAFEFAQDTVKQLITLSTAIISLTVTFSKDIISSPNADQQSLLLSSWIMFLLSILFGVCTLCTLAGSLESSPNPRIYQGNIRIPSILQILCFLIALILTIWFGIIPLEGAANISVK